MGRYGCIGNVIRAGCAGGVINHVGVLVNPHVSSCIATWRKFLDTIRGIRLAVFGLAGLSGLGSLAGDSRSGGGSTGAIVHGYGDDEGGLLSEDECLW